MARSGGEGKRSGVRDAARYSGTPSFGFTMPALRRTLLWLLAVTLVVAAHAIAQDPATVQSARVQRGQWTESTRWLQQEGKLLPDDAPLDRKWHQKELELEWQFTVGLFDQVPSRARTPEMTSHPLTVLAWTVDGWNNSIPVEVNSNAARLAELRAASPQSIELQLIEPQARALVLLGKGLPDSAVALLRIAARLEAAQPVEAGTPRILRPAHEALAELLLALGRAPEAQAAFERALVRTPDRARPLAGLALAARAAGDTVAAERALTTLRANFKEADAGAEAWLMKSFRVGK